MWAATEMKYKRQMTAMRKRNLELTEKLKEVRACVRACAFKPSLLVLD